MPIILGEDYFFFGKNLDSISKNNFEKEKKKKWLENTGIDEAFTHFLIKITFATSTIIVTHRIKICQPKAFALTLNSKS